MARLPVCLQMYTLRDDSAKDYVGTLRKVAEMGYEGVELLAAPAGMTAGAIRKLLEDLGLKTPGGHDPYEQLDTNLNKVIDFNLELGATHVTIPALRPDLRDSADAWRRTARRMTEMGKEISKHGMKLCYHNHSFEFAKYDGKYGIDILFDESDPRYVNSELDTYWVRHGGEDPVDYLKKLANRVPLVHLKDMAEDRSYAEVGEGLIDWNPVFAAAEKSGAQWYIVEQDTCKRAPIESARMSLENLRRMGKLG